jgi:alpha-glucosidase
MIKMKEVKITNGSRLSFNLLQSGGAGIYIAKKICPPKVGICSGYMTDGDDYWGRSAKMTKGSEPVMWNAEEEGLHLVGNADFAMNVPDAKLYTLRFFYSAIEPWEVVVTNGIDTVNKKMSATNSNRTFITCEVQLFLQKGVNNVTVKRKSGFVPVIEKIRLINNNPSPVIVLGAEKAILSNGAELIMSNSGQWEAVGLGYTAEMFFEDIYVPEAGKYILCIDYCGGESRDICACINNSEKIETYLHSTAGWFFPTWNNMEGKELLVDLQSGNNTIRLCNPEGRMSHIRGISIKKD